MLSLPLFGLLLLSIRSIRASGFGSRICDLCRRLAGKPDLPEP